MSLKSTNDPPWEADLSRNAWTEIHGDQMTCITSAIASTARTRTTRTAGATAAIAYRNRSQPRRGCLDKRLKRTAEQHPGMSGGLQNRVASVPYLFSGLLKCAECGANLTILMGRGKNRKVLLTDVPTIFIGESVRTIFISVGTILKRSCWVVCVSAFWKTQFLNTPWPRLRNR